MEHFSGKRTEKSQEEYVWQAYKEPHGQKYRDGEAQVITESFYLVGEYKE